MSAVMCPGDGCQGCAGCRSDSDAPVENAMSGTHGCCADKACNDRTCMELPTGKTCGDCCHFRHCAAFYGHKPADTYCDFFPRRFSNRAAIAKASA